MKTLAFLVAFVYSAHAQSLATSIGAVLQSTDVPGILENATSAVLATPSLAPALTSTAAAPGAALVLNTTAAGLDTVPVLNSTAAALGTASVLKSTAAVLAPIPSAPMTTLPPAMVPSLAPPVQAFAGAPVTGAPLNAQPLLVPGTVAVIAPPSFGNATLPGELPPLPLLSSIARPLLARLSGYTLHLLGSSAFLPKLPAPLHYQSVQGGIVAVLDGIASTARVPFQATVLGISPAYSALAGSPALSPVPANFSAPAINGLNVTYFALAPGTALPAVSTNFEFAQLAPGVLAILRQEDGQYLLNPPVTEASPAAPQASTAQSLIASLTPADIAAFPSVPQGLQIILLPASVSLAGFPAASPIPASFTVPQQLQSYDYILTSASDPLPALPAGYNASSPTAGITIIYADAASPPPPAPAGPPAASVLALPLSAVMEGPFVLSAGAPAAAGFQAPPYLQGFRFSELPAYSLLPTVPSGFVVLPIYPGLTAVVQTNSSLVSATAPAPASSPVMNSPLPEALLTALPDFGTTPGSVLTGLPSTANASQALASFNVTLYTGVTSALPANETYYVESVQPIIAALFPGFTVEGVFGGILGVVA